MRRVGTAAARKSIWVRLPADRFSPRLGLFADQLDCCVARRQILGMRFLFHFRAPGKKLRAACLLLVLCAIAPGAPATRPSVSGDSVLKYLDHFIDWYHRISGLDASHNDSQELLYRQSAQTLARNSLQLAFTFASAQAQLIESQGGQNSAANPSATTAAHLKQAAAAADQRVNDLKNQISESYRTAKTVTDAARQSKLAAELNLVTTQRDALLQYAGFMATTSGGPESLSDKVIQLQQSVPELTPATGTDAAKAAAAASAPPAQIVPDSAGIITLVSQLFTLTERIDELRQLNGDAMDLQQFCDRMREPIRAQVLDDMRRANALGATTQNSAPASTQSVDTPQKLDADRLAIESLTLDFKLTSSAGIPLGEQSVYLAQAQQILSSWREALERQYADDARSLALRALGTALVIIVIIIISELWRRATFRYISDPRRRRQFMLVRRIVIGFIVVMIIIASVVTEFGSLATFAGLITAGIAVSLQTVILSGVAYFFFIGRFGVRVGDRVTVSGITGDVVEIGLFRIYLMELAGPISDLHSTGRMIVFSNSVLFQPSAFYKQLPGAEYAWHEIALTMSPDTDHDLAEKRLMSAVESVFAGYRDAVDRQHEEANLLLHVPLEAPRPQVRLRLVDAGVEVVIRYPVELSRASKIEDQLTRKLLEAIQQEPKLKMVSAGTPRIQAGK
jgi:small-conductance mechanosensitive channel